MHSMPCHRRTVTAVAIIFVALLPLALGAQANQGLSLAECLRGALTADPRMKELGAGARELAAQERLWAADHGPVLRLGGNPLASAASADGQAVDLGFGLGAGLSQALPGEGSLSANLAHSMALQTDGSQSSFRQSPSAALSWQQPILVNGKLVDAGLTEAGRALQLDLPARRLAVRELATANAVAAEVVKNWYNLALLEDSLRLQDARIAIGLKNREILLAKQALGQVSPTETGKAELELGRLRASRIETEASRRQLQARLLTMCGLAVWRPMTSQPLPRLELPSEAQLRTEAAARSKEMLDVLAELDEARAGLVLAGRDQAVTLELSVAIRPQAAGTGSADFGQSFSDLTGSAAKLNPSAQLSLSLPAIDGGRSEAKISLARSKLSAAEERQEMVKNGVLQRLDEALGRWSMGRQKVDMYDSQLAWHERQLDIVRAQAGLGAALELELAQAQANRDETAIERRRAELEALAACLDLLDLCGHSLARDLGLTTTLEGAS